MLREEIKQQTKGYIMAGLGLVAGLAWNEAIKALIEYLYPLDKNSLLAKFVYAALITIIVVVFTTYLFGSKEESK
ncbi:hypothetical protein A3H08_04180 [Candidatus Giovannonibacteria bacterium RIFCSPLOWO2_12_FULL_44_32]|nr:MAG: hypothetical protein A3H08_04180 [Candidatus Giovannonibacteria bacterium RIFCSPLOWO2_12_FULL_44_32]